MIKEHPRLHPFAPIFSAPGAVLCGPFLGQGSKAMIVSFKSATCGGSMGWAAFRRHAGRWNLVWRYGNGQRSLAKQGTEIEETLNILRPTDPRCVPTGGTKSRTWRWNGSRFVAGPWQSHYLDPEDFRSPDGRAKCYLDQAGVECVAFATRSGPEYSAHLSPSGDVSTCAVAAASLYEHCFQQWAPGLPVLRYGEASELFGFRCASAPDGLTCTKLAGPGTGKGFRISGDGAVEI